MTLVDSDHPRGASPVAGRSEPVGVMVGLDAVIVAVTREIPRVLTVVDASDEAPPALPAGPLDAARDRTLERALRGWVVRQTGLDIGYIEQLYTFADRDRDPLESRAGERVLSVAYLALALERAPAAQANAAWRDIYPFLPWEDRRSGPAPIIASTIAPALSRWAEDAAVDCQRVQRRLRNRITFGLDGAAWDPERALERYELLYESGFIAEAHRDSGIGERVPPGLGEVMALDHRRMLATALSRLRGKIRYRPVVFELLPRTFTLLALQRTVEALSGMRVHKQNFRRLIEQAGLVEGTGEYHAGTGGRPAELFRFRRDVVGERPAPGVGLPTTSTKRA